MKKINIESVNKPGRGENIQILKKISDNQDRSREPENKIIAQSIVFSVALLTGTALLAFISYTSCDWFYLTLFYFTLLIIGFLKFFK